MASIYVFLLVLVIAFQGIARTDSTFSSNGIGWDDGMAIRHQWRNGFYAGHSFKYSEYSDNNARNNSVKGFHPGTLRKITLTMHLGKTIANTGPIALGVFVAPAFGFSKNPLWEVKPDAPYAAETAFHLQAGIEPSVWFSRKANLGARFGLGYIRPIHNPEGLSRAAPERAFSTIGNNFSLSMGTFIYWHF